MLQNYLRVAIDNMLANKLRAILAILGITIGIASVIAVFAFGEGYRKKIEQEIRKFGSDIFWINPQPLSSNHSGTPSEQNFSDEALFTDKDLNALTTFGTSIKALAPVSQSSAIFQLRLKEFHGLLMATNEHYQRVRHVEMTSGRFMSAMEVALRRRVCVLEYIPSLQRELVGCNDGKPFIRINNVRFEIIGMAKKLSTAFGANELNLFYIPISTAQELGFVQKIQTLYAQVSENDLEKAMRQAGSILKSRMSGQEKFEVSNVKMLYETEKELTTTAIWVTAAIATVSLIVGGIGIMNILMMSVTERTREIGIRRACGAKRCDIQYQFLVESAFLTTTGGVLGVVLGILTSYIVGQIVKIPIYISIPSVAVSIISSTTIGLGFGLYPAFKAVNVPPTEAIRHE